MGGFGERIEEPEEGPGVWEGPARYQRLDVQINARIGLQRRRDFIGDSVELPRLRVADQQHTFRCGG